MSTIERAIAIAAQAHAGQVDKAGEPYILHPLRVMLSLSTPDERIAGILHDVVEKGGVTLDRLRHEGFGDAVLAAIEALTDRPGEAKMDAAARAKRHAVALRVKLADNADNLEMSRRTTPAERDLARIEEYVSIRAFLESA